MLNRILEFEEPVDFIYSELEIYKDYSGNEKNSIVEKLNYTKTQLGRIMLSKVLANRTKCIQETIRNKIWDLVILIIKFHCGK
jgi:hypothetical protein